MSTPHFRRTRPDPPDRDRTAPPAPPLRSSAPLAPRAAVPPRDRRHPHSGRPSRALQSDRAPCRL